MLSLSTTIRRTLAIRPLHHTLLQTASYVTARKDREIVRPHEEARDDMGTVKAANNDTSSMDQITNLLDKVAITGSSQSNNFRSELLSLLHVCTHLSSSCP